MDRRDHGPDAHWRGRCGLFPRPWSWWKSTVHDAVREVYQVRFLKKSFPHPAATGFTHFNVQGLLSTERLQLSAVCISFTRLCQGKAILGHLSMQKLACCQVADTCNVDAPKNLGVMYSSGLAATDLFVVCNHPVHGPMVVWLPGQSYKSIHIHF